MSELVAVRLPNYLGETVMAEPMLAALLDAGLELALFGRPWAGDLLAGRAMRFAPAARGRDEVRQLRAAGATWGLAVRTSFNTALRMRLAGLKVIGRRGNLRSFLLYRALPSQSDAHRVDELTELGQLALATIIGQSSPVTAPAPSLQPTAEHMECARSRLRDAGVEGAFVMCCPTAGHRRPSVFKLWPAFPDFMRRLLAHGHDVVMAPAPGETDWYRGVPEGVRVLENAGVDVLFGALGLADAMISNDTGPAHLAAAVGVPTLTVFGHTVPERYAPRGPRATHIGANGAWPTLEEGWAAFERLKTDPAP